MIPTTVNFLPVTNSLSKSCMIPTLATSPVRLYAKLLPPIIYAFAFPLLVAGERLVKTLPKQKMLVSHSTSELDFIGDVIPGKSSTCASAWSLCDPCVPAGRMIEDTHEFGSRVPQNCFKNNKLFENSSTTERGFSHSPSTNALRQLQTRIPRQSH